MKLAHGSECDCGKCVSFRAGTGWATSITWKADQRAVAKTHSADGKGRQDNEAEQ